MKDLSADVPKRPGTYALVFHCGAAFETQVGQFGPLWFSTGYWVYVGSAFGPGGLHSRLGRHLRPTKRCHWHVDYIKSKMAPVESWTTTDPTKREHAWADACAMLKGASFPVANFGSTDCRCRSHLIHFCRKPRFTAFCSALHHLCPLHRPLFQTIFSKGK